MINLHQVSCCVQPQSCISIKPHEPDSQKPTEHFRNNVLLRDSWRKMAFYLRVNLRAPKTKQRGFIYT